MKGVVAFAASLLALPAQADVTIDWVTVGGPGNACDQQYAGCYGAVAYEYRISKYEVTNAEYAEFLNAVAATDTYGLYNTWMGVPEGSLGGITRSGSSGSYTYSAIAGREQMPVNYVSFYDALRFVNWLHNGQPTGAQDTTTTEDGAYTMITESYPGGPFITRNPGATVFLPSEDEWYKAAYYDAGSASYFRYPAGSDTETACAVPGATANTANCGDPTPAVDDLTNVGSYTGSPSPYGTFDQGGNIWELNEAHVDGWTRGLRGGGFDYGGLAGLWAAGRFGSYPDEEGGEIGLRVASPVPAPAVPSLSPRGAAVLGGLVFGIGVMGLVIPARRRFNRR